MTTTQRRVVIIGGGNMGVGLLYHLAMEGWTDITLLEKGELTSGSTWHAAGLCPSFIADYNMSKIHHYGNTLYPQLEEMTGQYVSWHGCGSIRFATNEHELDYFKLVAGIADNSGAHMEIIDPAKIKEIVPWIELEGWLRAPGRPRMAMWIRPVFARPWPRPPASWVQRSSANAGSPASNAPKAANGS